MSKVKKKSVEAKKKVTKAKKNTKVKVKKKGTKKNTKAKVKKKSIEAKKKKGKKKAAPKSKKKKGRSSKKEEPWKTVLRLPPPLASKLKKAAKKHELSINTAIITVVEVWVKSVGY